MSRFDSITLRAMAEGGSRKWSAVPRSRAYPETIGMWLAEMDLGIADEVRDLLVDLAHRGDLGYTPTGQFERARAATRGWLSTFGWEVDASKVAIVGDVLAGLSHVIERLTTPGSAVIVPTPAYMPFLTLPAAHGREVIEVPSILGDDGLWRLNYEGIRQAFHQGGELLVLCNPWNPCGRCLTGEELAQLADIVEEAGGRVFEDCVHMSLVLDGGQFTPYSTLDDRTAHHTIAAVSASKGWNTPGLKCAQLVFNNDDDASAFSRYAPLAASAASLLGVHATRACFEDALAWNTEVRSYLSANRDLLEERVAAWPGVTMAHVEGTYIAFLDFSGLDLGDSPAKFLATNAGVALTAGASCGRDYGNWARLVFATSRGILTEALDRIEKALPVS